MKYQIFEMSYHKLINNGEVEDCMILKNVKSDNWFFEDVHESVERCEGEIKKHQKDLENKNLVILPIICVDYDGKISEHQRV